MSTQGYEHLLSPLTICGKTYRNRVGTSPMSRFGMHAEEGCREFAAKARGGAGVVAVGECFVDAEYSCREDDPPLYFTDLNGREMEIARGYVEAIKSNGAIAMVELNHCGQSKVGGFCSNNIAIGPDEWEQPDGIRNVAMDEAMMEHVADNFAQCAWFMKQAGFDGVIPFCGHGWLLHQFLSPRMNHRTDAYGGSLENRARFPMMVLRRIREKCGYDFIIEPRVSGEESMPGGMEKEEVAQFCQMLEKEKLADIIQVSQGVYRDPVRSREFSTMFHEPACNSHISQYIKERINLPVSVVGGINSPELIEKILAEGRCDIALLGRQYFADPDLARKVMEGQPDEARHCVRCSRCFGGPHEEMSAPSGEPPKEFTPPMCTVNPMHAREFYGALPEGKAAVSRRVLVIGGGPGGLTAAIYASDRGHEVTLVEKTGELGGIIRFCDYDVHKTDLRFFKDQLIRRAQRRGVKFLLNTEVTKELLDELKPEHIICAVGSHAAVFPIPGIENAIHGLEVYWHPEKVGKRVIMVGGGLVGCETGLHLADTGHEVTIIEMADKLAAEAIESSKLHRIMLLELLAQKTRAFTGLRCSEITATTVKALDKDGNEHLFEGDTVVFALGMRSNSDDVEKLRALAGDIPFVPVGDCVRARQVAQAGFEAVTAAYGI